MLKMTKRLLKNAGEEAEWLRAARSLVTAWL